MDLIPVVLFKSKTSLSFVELSLKKKQKLVILNGIEQSYCVYKS